MAEEKKGKLPSSLKEARQHGSFSFPCAFYQAVPETTPPGFPFTVKHHWRDPDENVFLEQDSYQVDINMTLTHLKSPCFCFINSGELHALTSDSEQYNETVYQYVHPAVQNNVCQVLLEQTICCSDETEDARRLLS